MKPLQRTLVITKVRDSTGQEFEIVGRFDVKKSAKQGLQILGQRVEIRYMDDLTYYNNSFTKEN